MSWNDSIYKCKIQGTHLNWISGFHSSNSPWEQTEFFSKLISIQLTSIWSILLEWSIVDFKIVISKGVYHSSNWQACTGRLQLFPRKLVIGWFYLCWQVNPLKFPICIRPKIWYQLRVCSASSVLTYWGRDKTAAIFQTTFSNAFSWMKMYRFPLRFQWS